MNVIYSTISSLKQRLDNERKAKKTIGLVPTMGALHAGHIALVSRCVAENDICVVSIFVNPTQFNDKNDLLRYPRTLEVDCELLKAAGCSVVFAPSETEMYPEPDTRIFNFGSLEQVMEGAFRPGHFNGVAQIVSKLFDIVQPDKAYFGEKDFQQLAIIREMTKQLDLNTIIVPYPIVREADGNELRVQGLNVHIKDNHILKDIDLAFPDKKITCIIGPSGCGKSTLLKTMNRLIDSVEGAKVNGEIMLGKENIIGSGEKIINLRRKIGLVSQKPCPLPMSIFENIAYSCKIHGIRNRRKLKIIVKYYLEAVGLWDEVKDRLNAPATRLSIGQQQRLCLARSLAVEPQYILADEATSALDPLSSKNIEELFVKLKRDYSIIMVTHTLQQAQRIADHVVFMYLGEVVETGNAKHVFNNPKHELTKKYLSGTFS